MVWLEDVRRSDQLTVGLKAAGLGELAHLGIPVPTGFVLTTSAYRAFVRTNRFEALLRRELGSLDPTDTRALHQASVRLTEALMAGRFDAQLERRIIDAYEELRLKPEGAMTVAVRPSDPPRDDGAATLGHHTTILGVAGTNRVLDAIRAVWASLFSARAIYDYARHNIAPNDVAAGIVVQVMVNADVAGVLTTIDATTGDRAVMTVEAVWGLGQAVVRGLLTPDRYTIDKATGEILDRSITTQLWKLARSGLAGKVEHVPVAAEAQAVPKLNDDQLARLVSLATTIESHFQFPQNTEWVIAKDSLYFVETQPLPRVSKKLVVRSQSTDVTTPVVARPLLQGTGATIGVATGPVRLIHRSDDLDAVRDGEVLVAELASPDFLPVMDRIAALVTDTGGRTSHAALLSHDFGIPMVVGTGKATHLLHEGQTVTVDGSTGRIYRGTVKLEDVRQQGSAISQTGDQVHTATKIMVNLANPSRALEVAKLNVDGVGLIRAEFMMAQIGEHPKAMLAGGRTREFTAKLADGIEVIARAFHPHPVVYRTSDLKSNEYRALKGGDQYEPHEENPMLGLRGTARYLADPAVFQAELAAVKEVRAHRGWENVQVMLPFVRTVDELHQAKEYLATAGLSAERTFKLRMMVEVPSTVFLIEQFLDEGVDGISIGSNDLTQLILGIDRESQQLRDRFNELDPAVVTAIATVIRACRARHIPVSVCGQAASTYPAFTEFVVREGVTSLSVDPSSVDAVRELVASVEHHLA